MITFELERIQSLYENTVEYNLTESGIHPYSLKSLLDTDQLDRILDISLGYGQTNGAPELRERICQLYPNANLHAEQILVTNGSAEANYVAMKSLLKPGDEILIMQPNYQQIWGIAQTLGCQVNTFHLTLKGGHWSPDMDEVTEKISPKTKLIALCHPNNPTGSLLCEADYQAFVQLAESVGAWLYVDEIYRGAELDGRERPSFLGMYDKVLVAGGLSKAYALPGLRLGWLAGPEAIISDAWSYHDYTSITAGILSHHVAAEILAEPIRQKILQRSRAYLNQNLDILQQWLKGHEQQFSFIPPQAGGMAFMQYHFPGNSTALSNYLRTQHNVFVIAGDCFGMDGYLRLGIGSEATYLLEGLQRISTGLEQWISTSQAL